MPGVVFASGIFYLWFFPSIKSVKSRLVKAWHLLWINNIFISLLFGNFQKSSPIFCKELPSNGSYIEKDYMKKQAAILNRVRTEIRRRNIPFKQERDILKLIGNHFGTELSVIEERLICDMIELMSKKQI